MALERKDIVAKALELLDEVGLEGLSTRRLAAALGVKDPSLLWHFASMGELRSFGAEADFEFGLQAMFHGLAGGRAAPLQVVL